MIGKLDEYQAICDAATPGEWYHSGIGYISVGQYKNAQTLGRMHVIPDAEYAAAACTAMPKLIACVRELEARWCNCKRTMPANNPRAIIAKHLGDTK